MIPNRVIQKESYHTVPETCPAVDATFSNCIEKVKEQTNILREGMNEWIERALTAENTIDNLELEVSDLKDHIKDLESEIADLNAEIRSLNFDIQCLQYDE